MTYREEFNRWFTELLYSVATGFDRDILRDSKEVLWEHWRRRALEYDKV